MAIVNHPTPLPAGDTLRGPVSTAQHPGIFFEMGEYELGRIQRAGYTRIGIGVVVLNKAGEILVIDHKGNPKLVDHTLGVTSETVAYESPGSRRAEPNTRTISRCLFEEVQIDPLVHRVRTRPESSFTFSDWPVGNTNRSKLLGINLALLLDDKAAEQVAGITETGEAYGASFVDIQYVLKDRNERMRPGTVECLRSLRSVGLLDVSEIGGANLALPAHDPSIPIEDIDLVSY